MAALVHVIHDSNSHRCEQAGRRAGNLEPAVRSGHRPGVRAKRGGRSGIYRGRGVVWAGQYAAQHVSATVVE